MTNSNSTPHLQYARSLTFDQIVAHLEFIGNSFFFGAKKAYKGFRKVDWEWLADAVNFQDLEAIQAVPLSMKQMAKLGKFSTQKYRTIRHNLEAIGCFTVEASAPRQGIKQPVTQLLGINYRMLVEIIRALYDRVQVIMVDFESHPLFPRHQFAFLMRWHTKVFGFRPDDRERTDEMKALALGDRNEYWRRTLYHEQFQDFANKVEAEKLHSYGWSEETRQDVRQVLAYPEIFRFEEWNRQCPDVSRLSPEEFALTSRLRMAVLMLRAFEQDPESVMFRCTFDWTFKSDRAIIIEHSKALLAQLNAALDYAMDPVNGSRNGRPIEHAHQWAWEFAKTKLVG